jgi:hypothetical protein
VLWILIGFNADPSLAFYHNSDPDPGSQTIADPFPIPDRLQNHKKLNFYMKNILRVGIGQKYTYEGMYKSRTVRQETRFSMLLDPDPQS